MKIKKRFILFLFILCMAFSLFGCASAKEAETTEETEDQETDLIVVGFSQVGAESDWRKANTESMMETFTREKGYDLVFEDAQQKQQNQMQSTKSL